jgi:DNA-binding MarR family transcriptional regulator
LIGRFGGPYLERRSAPAISSISTRCDMSDSAEHLASFRTSQSSVDDESRLIWVNLLRIQRRLQRVVERRLKRIGLPPLVWHDVLQLLASQSGGELSALDIEQRLSLRQYQVSRLVDHLTQGGLVSRRRLVSVGRPIFVCLTERGRDLQQRMAEVYASTVDTELTSQFRPQEVADAIILLNRLLGIGSPSGQSPAGSGCGLCLGGRGESAERPLNARENLGR